jgi:hypothetical protein
MRSGPRSRSRTSWTASTKRSCSNARSTSTPEKLREELTLARIDRHSGQLEELDVEGILAFAERSLPRAADLWVQASLDQRQRFQQLFFPDGIAFDGNRFIGTAQPHRPSATCGKSELKMKVWWT